MNMIDQKQFEEQYQEYIQEFCSQLDKKSLAKIHENFKNTSWEHPESSLDFNNIGVLCLLNAEKTSDKTERQLYLNLALDVFNQGIEIDNNPFCIAHLSILLALIGELTESNLLAFPNLIEQISLSSFLPTDLPSGLIYIPQKHSRLSSTRQEILGKILETDKGYQQSLILLALALQSGHIIFYNESSLRNLNFVTRILPETVFFNLKLGISNLVNGQMEGLFYLHQSYQGC